MNLEISGGGGHKFAFANPLLVDPAPSPQ